MSVADSPKNWFGQSHEGMAAFVGHTLVLDACIIDRDYCSRSNVENY